jgi:hypothetical protein
LRHLPVYNSRVGKPCAVGVWSSDLLPVPFCLLFLKLISNTSLYLCSLLKSVGNIPVMGWISSVRKMRVLAPKSWNSERSSRYWNMQYSVYVHRHNFVWNELLVEYWWRGVVEELGKVCIKWMQQFPRK